MKPVEAGSLSLVSVVIPCYNQGRFLAQAIQSALNQEGARVEVIVINDGSFDDTEVVAQSFPQVIYRQQQRVGTAAARNAGIEISKGDFLLFLDADDMLQPGAIKIQLEYLSLRPDAAFVSGGHSKADIQMNVLKEETHDVEGDHYVQLLRRNYIGLCAAVLFRRSIFSDHAFDISLRGMEDYDLFLKVARKHHVIHHTNIVAVHRQHRQCISADLSHMLTTVLRVLDGQYKYLRNAPEKIAYQQGVKHWVHFYSTSMIWQLRRSSVNKGVPFREEYLSMLKRFQPKWYWRYQLSKFPIVARFFS
jgi:glycosyltransferase involved in cell wall biosynthesis